MSFLNTKRCLICRATNATLYWHKSDTDIWTWCNKCDTGRSIQYYCHLAGIPLHEFLKLTFDFQEAKSNEVSKIEWPKSFVPLFDQRAKEGLEYLASRGIDPDGDMYYDLQRNGIVFPYNYETVFCGAQIRLIKPWIDNEGKPRKIDTLPGTRLGLLFYNWNQKEFMPHVKGVIITEGAFNCLAIQQALNTTYGSLLTNPWKVIACSGSGASKYHLDTIKELKDKGLKIILAPDADEAGLKMLKKFSEAGAVTHYAITGDDELDWNDFSKQLSKYDFVEWFFKQVKHV